ncbi:histone deacetylase family protein [Marinobacter sp. UBA2688]|uniref:histone deacetylase family protein n=1 Tax=Marinobacter sp. UBA2688 TaxID=1946816 RepID=UPI00257EEE1F|nr:histone deacetylase family protein [Marinobacter sp. UBA2688]|tara:strand:- start:10451 stop:11494 length:1044 start_codon:yes stop_codon:yes gene_type:complete
MHFFYSSEQKAHSPSTFLVRGEPTPSPEHTGRADRLLAALESSGHEVNTHNGGGSDSLDQRLQRIHTARYLTFLQTIHQRWKDLPGASDVVTPNVHPTGGGQRYTSHPVAQAGWHLHDMACPIGPTSYQGIRASAATAEIAAEFVKTGQGDAYALCRPPGHHAGPESAGGFCFINNTALAASVLRERLDRVAIIDVDLHHGNGTQDIFYSRGDVWTGSVHADTEVFYPFFWGSSGEQGTGDGLGCNLNVPLPLGSDGTAFMLGLETLISGLRMFQPEAIVVALGLDAHKDDPLAGLALEISDFFDIGARLAALPHPCILVQEGGYPTDTLGINLAAFIDGFTQHRQH